MFDEINKFTQSSTVSCLLFLRQFIPSVNLQLQLLSAPAPAVEAPDQYIGSKLLTQPRPAKQVPADVMGRATGAPGTSHSLPALVYRPD